MKVKDYNYYKSENSDNYYRSYETPKYVFIECHNNYLGWYFFVKCLKPYSVIPDLILQLQPITKEEAFIDII